MHKGARADRAAHVLLPPTVRDKLFQIHQSRLCVTIADASPAKWICINVGQKVVVKGHDGDFELGQQSR